MKLFHKAKDGGPESTVTGYWLIEAKNLFSIALLKFEGESRPAFHTHAFNSVSWLLSGLLTEIDIDKSEQRFVTVHFPSLKPIFTWRNTFHQVSSKNPSWVLTFRGPWVDRWTDYDLKTGKASILTHGRRVL